MKLKSFFTAAVILAVLAPAGAGGFEIGAGKYLIPAPAPLPEPGGVTTPDGAFNLRDPDAPFHSDRLADALWLDDQGRDRNGAYLNLNRAIYTRYYDADAGPASTILILMPGTWAGAMSMDRFARDLLRMAAKDGRKGLEVWLIDRRSEQLEDHTGIRWAQEDPEGLAPNDVIQRVSDYYAPAFDPNRESAPLLGKTFTPLDRDALRFMAGWGADVAIRDWRAVVLEAHRRVGNEVIGTEVDRAVVHKKPGRHVFIGGHSLGGSLTVLYAAYDFDRRPDHEILGMDDVDGLVLLEGGSPKLRPVKTVAADAYLKDAADRYRPGEMVFFDFNVLGIQYAPSTMLSIAIAGWAAEHAPAEEAIFPDYARPSVARLPHATNAAVLGLAFDDDVSPMFIARASIGYPAGRLGMGGQLRKKTATIPMDPGDCPLVTPWRPGHVPMDADFLHDWVNIDESGNVGGETNCRLGRDDPEVTDFYDFARSLTAGPIDCVGDTVLCSGPNDYPEWYFPPRLSSDSRLSGQIILDQGRDLELMASPGADRLTLPFVSLIGDDSSGDRRDPKLDPKDYDPAALAWPETAVHNLIGYTHLDICCATRNNQPDLIADGHEHFNASAVHAYRFIGGVTEKLDRPD